MLIVKNAVCVQFHRSGCRKETVFKIAARNSKLGHSLISSSEVKDISHCVKLCLDNNSCQSVNYLDDKSNKPTCELLGSVFSGNGSLISSNGWKFYQPVNTTVCLYI